MFPKAVKRTRWRIPRGHVGLDIICVPTGKNAELAAEALSMPRTGAGTATRGVKLATDSPHTWLWRTCTFLPSLTLQSSSHLTSCSPFSLDFRHTSHVLPVLPAKNTGPRGFFHIQFFPPEKSFLSSQFSAARPS